MRGFGRNTSPERFFPLFIEAARNIHQGAKALQRMLEEYQGTDEEWRAVEEYEHEGDKITHRIHQALHQSRMRAGEREVLHKLTGTLDDVIDLIEGVAARLYMYRVERPTPEALRLAEIILRSTDRVVQGVSALPDPDRIQAHCIEINRLENEADEVSREAIAALFQGGVPPLDVVKWKEIYETMETVTDHCEDVANRLEEICLRRA